MPTLPEAKADQGSAGSLPAADDQSTSTPDGKKVISQSAATALMGATGGVLPDHYVVKDEPKPAPPAAAPENQDPDPDPEPGDNTDPFDVDPADAGQEGETGTPDAEPEKEPFPTSTPEGEPTPSEDGYTYGKIGVVDYRQDSDGNVFFQENINGEIAWIKDTAYKAGFQLKQHTDRERQQFNEERKAFDKKKEFDSILNTISGAPKKTEDGDDLWGSDAGGSTSDPEVTRLKKEVDALKAKDAAAQVAQTEAQQRDEFDRQVNLARAEMDEFCDLQGVKPPSDNQLIAMCQEYAANEDIPLEKVAVSPVDLIKMVKGKITKRKKGSKPSADSTPTPPTGAAPRKATPLPSKQLAEVNKELADLREKSAKFGGNNPKIAAELIALSRKKKELLQGK